MKKYNLSKIMKRAWELVKKAGMTISSGLKKAWEEAKAAMQKIKFETHAKVAKIERGEANDSIYGRRATIAEYISTTTKDVPLDISILITAMN